MRSKASLRGHPIHPAIIPFPLAFFIGGFVFDLAGVFLQRPLLWPVGYYLTIAGVGAALIAAVPGFIDYFFTVPPMSSGRARATKHMLAMLTVVGLFAVAWLIRDSATSTPTTAVLALEGAGSILLGIGGWLGGTLVTRNLISVDHRYAQAGRWKEESLGSREGQTVVVARKGELQVNQMKLVHLGGRRIVVGRTEDGYVAFDDRCTHRGGSLADGAMICGTVQCLWHGSQFDARSGKVRAGPAESPIRTYTLEQQGDEVRLTLNGQGERRKPPSPQYEPRFQEERSYQQEKSRRKGA
jgi:uncharacterized membrane protein/nitrite reductase/ring-hydroxylating ferredoxin subunit